MNRHNPCTSLLPLDDSPATDVRCHVHDVTESKSGHFPGPLNGILPLIFPQTVSNCRRYPAKAHLIMYQVRQFFGGPL